MATAPDEAGKLLQVSLQIADGAWLNFSATVEPAESIWSIRFILSMAVMVVAVVLLSTVVVYHLNRPLRVFARAARRLGRDVHRPPHTQPVLVAGLTISHGLSMAFYVTDRATALDLAGGEHVGEQIVAIARLVEKGGGAFHFRQVQGVTNPNEARLVRLDQSDG